MCGLSLAGLIRAVAGEEDGDILLVLLEGVDDLRSHLFDDVLLLDLEARRSFDNDNECMEHRNTKFTGFSA